MVIEDEFWGKYLDEYTYEEIFREYDIQENKKYISFDMKLSEQMSQDIVTLCNNKEYTLLTYFLASLNILLYKYTGKSDILVAVPTCNTEEIAFIPVRKKIDHSLTIKEMLLSTGSNLMKSYKYQNYWKETIDAKEYEAIEQNITEVILCFNRLHDTESIFDILENSKNKLAFMILQNDTSFLIKAFCRKDVLDKTEETLGKLVICYSNVLCKLCCNTTQPINQIEIITEEEKKYICNDYNNTEESYNYEVLLHELFQKQANMLPDQIAIINYDKKITYKELDLQSNKVSHYLIEQGVARGDKVAITNERDIETICSVLGILKAGATYVPIDGGYPEERINYIMKQSNCKLLLRSDSYKLKGMDKYSDEQLNCKISCKELAYIIFTSGSTGQPKGVEITHQAASNTIIDINQKFKLGIDDRILAISSMCFDLSVYDIFGALSSGATLVQINDQRDVNDILDVVEKQKITLWNSVPAIMEMVVNSLDASYENTTLRAVLLSGDWIPIDLPKQITNHFTQAKVTSLGGATEAAIWSIYYPITKMDENWISIPYGRPLANQKFYVLSKDLQLMPMNVTGELYIGGVGVAQGYSNDIEKTKKAFITHPIYGRLYKTGDYGKLQEDGYIVFQGRKDEQVKIRGFRVELGEIEHQILKNEKIERAVVVSTHTKKGGMHLCAFIVAKDKIDTDDLKQQISKYLPSYMIPSNIIQLESMPLSKNGKVDVNSLKEYQTAIDYNDKDEADYIAPTNQLEKEVVEIWENILGINKISMNENFFILGGDSLKAIQMISSLQKKGIKATIHQLFDNPTVEQFCQQVKESEIIINQDMVVGELALTPIQNYFFSIDLEAPNLFNQYVVISSKNKFNINHVRGTASKLIEHHDLLRAKYVTKGGQIKQYIADVKECFIRVEEINLEKSTNWEQEYKKAIDHINKQIDITAGKLVSIGLIKTQEEDLLCICIHHLVVDGISWRIILEDFIECYENKLNNKDICLPKKTNSYLEWSNELEVYWQKGINSRVEKYWSNILTNDAIQVDNEINSGDGYESKSVYFSFDEKDTYTLTKKINGAYKTNVQEILLAALEMALNYYNKKGKVLVNVEAHGREELLNNINITRTVGWFTSMYPIILNTSISNIPSHIKYIKNMMKEIPNKGFDFNILRFANGNKDFAKLAKRLEGGISFNYLGEMDVKSEMFGLYDYKLYSASENRWPYELDINGMIVAQQLSFEIKYNTFKYKEEEINEIINYYKLSLKSILAHCKDIQNEIGETINDEKLNNQNQMDYLHLYDNFPLTDVQMAYMLGRSEDYEMGGVATHMYLEVETALDMELFEASLQKVIDRHPMMRAGISPNGYQYFMKETPKYKLVVDEVEDQDRLQEQIEKVRSRMSHFIFQTDTWPLFEFKAIKLGKNRSYLFIGYDLLMADATSIMQIIMRELLDFYNNPQLTLPELQYTFRDYVIAYQNYKKESVEYEEDKNYWLGKLEEFPTGLRLPYKVNPQEVVRPRFNRLTYTMEHERWSKLKRAAQQKGITPSVILATAYAHILAYWGNQDKLAINLTVFNRQPFHEEVYSIVGDFTSIILLETNVKAGMSFWDNAKFIQASLLDALDHRHYDGVEFIRELSKKHSIGTGVMMPFVFTSMLFNNISNDLSQLGEIKWSVSQTSQVYIDNQVMESEGNLIISWDYVDQIFDSEVIETMFDQYTEILSQLLENIDHVKLYLPAKQENLLVDYNKSDSNIKPGLLHELFSIQAKKTPDNQAVIFNDIVMTYGELNKKSNQLAKYLVNQGVTRNKCVGVIADRCPNSIINILAILKAGGAYIPIEASYPDERRKFILQNAESNILLDKDSYDLVEANQYGEGDLPLINSLKDIAYVIYTSGSTGKPKGVVIPHDGAANTILDINEKYKVTSDDRIIGLSSMCFDLSVYDIFGSLASGATLIMVEDQRDAIDILKLVEKYEVTIWNSVPAIMDMTVNTIKVLSGNDGTNKYYWSPFLQWRIDDNILYIADKSYEEFSDLNDSIQSIYFASQEGISQKELLSKIKKSNKYCAREFIEQLIADKVLIDSILVPHELYGSQDKLLKHEYESNFFIDSDKYARFKHKQLSRYTFVTSEMGYVQLKACQYPKEIADRHSYRTFDENRSISIDMFSRVLFAFYQGRKEEEIRYNYASAGGLYPIDLYIHIKKNRVEGIEEGLYLYNPIYNSLELIDNQGVFDDKVQYFTNKDIFNSSAFSIYFIYNAEVTMPKYGGLGYYYAGIDTGIMVGLLTQVCELAGLGVCSIGDMNFDKIKDYFHLTKNQILLHSVECGLKNDENQLLPILEENNYLEHRSRHRRQEEKVKDNKNTSLRLVILSGDWIPLKLPNDLKEYFLNANIISMGGATEASIWSIYYPINNIDSKWNSIPYGYPLANQQIFILSENLLQCPVKVKGEIYIGGVGVAYGYQNDEEKTGQAFIHHDKFGLLYKTGDYGMMDSNGYVIFLGRKDFQVKIRGYRIELGEIESCILEMEGIESVIVTDIMESEGKQSLCAYYTGTKFFKEDIVERIQSKLPSYMIPSHFIHLGEFPLTNNGKIDRKSLPLPRKEEVTQSSKRVAQNEIQKQVMEMWTEILDIEEIDINDNFFDLGGYSIQATLLLGKIKSVYKVEIPLKEIFTSPTIKNISEIISCKLKSSTSIKAKNILAKEEKAVIIHTEKSLLLREGTESSKNIFLIHDVTGELEGYIDFSKFIDLEFNCWGIRVDYITGNSPKYLDFDTIAKEYIGRIKEIQPCGPYIIGGWSTGGVIALKIVQLLEQMGADVSILYVFDGITPEEESSDLKESFDLSSEKALLQKGFKDNSQVDFTMFNNVEELWNGVIDYCDQNPVWNEMLKNLIYQKLGSLYNAIPNIDKADLGTIVHYTNVIRSISNLYYGYYPKEKVKCKLVFFHAEDSEYSKNIEDWSDFTKAPVDFYEIKGSHFSIFEPDMVKNLATIFNRYLSN